MGADRESGDLPPHVGHLGDYRHENLDHLLLSAPIGDTLVRVRADPPWPDRMANVATVATLDPVGALRMTVECLNALYHLQIFQSQIAA